MFDTTSRADRARLIFCTEIRSSMKKVLSLQVNNAKKDIL